ncbi:hypothetical protein [Spirillospora albida]|uniref:hypothetical protein n=1 Tax=Spirillospora albida TaxID=58123 RepID=UPI0004C13D9B|nr:hypothetical protein [Spirillospora albida]
MPSSVRAVRVLLFVAAGLTVMAALDAGFAVGGARGFGVALAVTVPAAAGVLAGLAIARRPSRWLWGAILALEILYVFWQLGRVANDDPAGVLGLIVPLVILVLACRAPARRYFRSAE